MSEEEKTVFVKYTEGPAELTLPVLGLSVERGFALEVPKGAGDQLIAQGWEESSKSEVKPDPETTPAPSDAAVKKAEELGVDIDSVEGTGSKGAVKVSDVEAAAEAIAEQATGDQTPSETPEQA